MAGALLESGVGGPVTKQVFRLELMDQSYQPRVEAFNQRMRDADRSHRMSVDEPFAKLEQAAGSSITILRYAAVIGDEIRGGVNIKILPFFIKGKEHQVAFYNHPLSEGIINPQYSMVAMLIHKEVIRRHPLIYGLGVGSLQEPVARLMQATGWSSDAVPFYFKVLRARPFLRNMKLLRGHRWRRWMSDVAAITRLGDVGLLSLKGFQLLAGKTHRTEGLDVARFEEWESWTDDLWRQSYGDYAFIGDRSVATLNALYPPDEPQFTKVKVINARDQRLLGWAVLCAADLRDHNYFGNMKLGTIVDMFAAPQDARAIVSSAIATLQRQAADIVVANQSHRDWTKAFEKAGMLPYRTNFFLFLSPQLQRTVGDVSSELSRFMVTRGDGDGPIHLT